MSLDLTKPVQLSDGRPARVICTDRKGPRPVLVLASFSPEGGEEGVWAFDLEGKGYTDKLQLVNVPEPNKFRNIYSNSIYGEDKNSLSLCVGIARDLDIGCWLGVYESRADGKFVAFHPKEDFIQ